MEELSRSTTVYAMDLLGQGKSWPTRAPNAADNLCYSVDLWTDQVLCFIQEVIGDPVFVAGNSLGGYLATNLAAHHPNWVRGLALWNATPFWAFRNPGSRKSAPTPPQIDKLSEKSGSSHRPETVVAAAIEDQDFRRESMEEDIVEDRGRGAGWFDWDGTLPAPAGLFRFGAWYFDRMRDPRTVHNMLKAVYSSADAVSDELIADIIAATERGPSDQPYGRGGHEAFTSIVFAPKASMSFEDMIARINVPMALMYGREDPWVVPLWGHRIKRQRPETLYYEISPSGHSPHHETPKTVNKLLAAWLQHAMSGGLPPLSKPGEYLEILEETGVVAKAVLIPDANPRGFVETLDSFLSSMFTASPWR